LSRIGSGVAFYCFDCAPGEGNYLQGPPAVGQPPLATLKTGYWLRSKGEGHLTRINDILINLMEAERRIGKGR
jgi:hypothetical protein